MKKRGVSKRINSVLRTLSQNFSTYRYHQYHKRTAARVLRGIEDVNGQTEKRLIKASDEYAREVLGWQGFAPWLYVYSAVNKEFREGWIPDNYFGKVVLPVLDGGYGGLSDLKAISRRIFNSEKFPDIAYYVNGLFLTTDYEVIPEGKVARVLFDQRNTIVFKLDNSMQGKGIFIFDNSSFDLKSIRSLGNGVFQYFINQHPSFTELMPSSVATLRLTTYVNDNGNVTVQASYLRVGRADEHSIKWSSNIIIPIDPISGRFNSQGYFLNFMPLKKHPDTQVAFAGRQIPLFTECCSTAIELHKKLPHDRCIGWDMIVDDQYNIKIMEWNGNHTDIKMHEALQGPCFKGLGWEDLWKRSG